MIGGKKKADLPSKFGAGLRIVEEIADAGNEVGAVKILHDRKHFHVGVFRLQKRHDLVIHGVDCLSLDHVEHRVGFGIDGLEMTVWTENLEPRGEEQIDLPGILAQGRETGGVP